MTKFSHSRVETFETCPYRYYLRYGEGLNVLPNNDDPQNALFLGTAIHEGIEHGVKEGIQKYFDSYPVIGDLHINESIKLEHWIPKVQKLVGDLCKDKEPIYEQMISHDDLIGFIDLLIPVEQDGDYKKFALYDFKYSNNVDRYLASRQLHEYKHFYEKANPFHEIVEMGFIFIPKTGIRQKKTEDLSQFRKRLKETLNNQEIKVVKVDYQQEKVIEFYKNVKTILETSTYEKRESRLCDFCEYKIFCQEGIDYMILPKNERRKINAASRKKVWLYGAPFSGKTTLADNFPNPVMLNTDGNLNSFTAPVIEIKETLEGRQDIAAWDNFKNAINELQKGGHGFETIVVDLIEDTYEHCRRWCYDKLGIEHESDNSFKAWDYVRNEFLTTIKKLMTLNYNIVLISHEDMSKDIMKKSGDKITAIRPNMQEKISNKLSGMVDIVGRVVADGDERTLQFKSDDVIFGGGRLKLDKTVIPLNYKSLEDVYGKQSQPIEEPKPEEPKQDEVKPEEPKPVEKQEESTPRRRRRRSEEEPKKEASYDDLIACATPVCEKYGQDELQGIMKEKFGIDRFVELKPEQYADAIAEVKKYEESKSSLI